MNFINLTNGLKATEFLRTYSFIRIQSTACEQKRWEFILNDIDHNFLMNLALGKTCKIYDYSEKKKMTRAMFQGIEWIRFVLNKRWFDRNYLPFVRGHFVQDYFYNEYRKLNRKTLKRIDYYKKFLKAKQLKIEVISGNVNDRTQSK